MLPNTTKAVAPTFMAMMSRTTTTGLPMELMASTKMVGLFGSTEPVAACSEAMSETVG